ncbi:MAG: putative ABC transporter ATP-binding protein [Chloroflexi bacterium OLB14]|nr:MAG: putative ABC transporter ATP-binding protein [Chloroflexi bacterium OLB14]
MNEFLVHAENLHKSFNDTQAVNGVTLKIKSGEIYGLVGSDGAGKTTTMRMLVGALLPTQGSINVCGYDVLKQVENARSQIGYLSQRFSLYEDLTVLENIRFFAEIRGLSSSEWLPRSLEILEFVGLEKFKDRRAGQLSGGMKQKLGLASALVTRPRLLLLDEPTTGVDPVTRQDFWQLVIKLVSQPITNHQLPITNHESQGVSVIISTPYMDEASRCHRIGFMKAGKIIAEDTPSKLRSQLNDRILELRGEPLHELKNICLQNEDVEEVAAFGDKLHLRVKDGTSQNVLSRLPKQIESQNIKVNNLRVVPPSLEDIFILLTEFNKQ